MAESVNWARLGLVLVFVAFSLSSGLAVQGSAEEGGPSETQCRPYIEKALKQLETPDLADESAEETETQNEEAIATEPEVEDQAEEEEATTAEADVEAENSSKEEEEPEAEPEAEEEGNAEEAEEEEVAEEAQDNSKEDSGESKEQEAEGDDSEEQKDEDHSEENTAAVDGDAKDDSKSDESEENNNNEGSKDEPESADNEAEEPQADEETADEAEVEPPAEAEADAAAPEESSEENTPEDGESEEGEDGASDESIVEEELTLETDIPTELRPRDHIDEILGLGEESNEKESVVVKVADITLKELKKLYDNAIRPLETLYKYRDLSNRHFGDPEIFSKPLILFMGPWSGGKSSIINYLVDNEYKPTSLRTGAEPSPAYFNILMHGNEEEVLDGTQLAADYTFAGLQKFGQGLEDRLKGYKLPSKVLEKVNIVEIPGILEVRKQVSRMFPFNDACQWFIDRADIIFLVYDPSKLDVGPETEAILDQLKGREYQTRILLNKADQVKPEELLRVQGALIWNISPLMSSAQPPVMYTVSLWSKPFESGSPSRLLLAQERALLKDLRNAIDKRVDNKIASARRFAVRVRNHAKMVDCYLTTYYNHKSVFGSRKLVAEQIIEHPQNYHIYEGLSTLTNISRYDLPDPEVYRDFFRLNALYDFQQLSATCTYFRGCPINRLDIAIAYDLPELVTKYKRLAEEANKTGQNATTKS